MHYAGWLLPALAGWGRGGANQAADGGQGQGAAAAGKARPRLARGGRSGRWARARGGRSGQGAATASKGRPQRAVDKGKGRPRRARGGLGGRRADPAAAVASGGQGAASAGGSCFLHRRAAGLGQE
ncbi:hypothetical protein E2562_014675 [Oryza meyeriana var. granulata]|uniref:Uncharacterized protein n=1 Tax=Oryza meyeriana var. granulata TaxID=110450 RepID=A0A6G1D5P7_9ORYZ|nr:hypothetical protein E2562_014675 [Oryza meyeriana var. granulata]